MTTPSLDVVSKLMKRKWKGKDKLCTLAIMSLILIYMTVFVIPIRNVILYPVIECAWRDVETIDLFKIYFGGQAIPEEMSSKIFCPVLRKPLINKDDINSSAILTYNRLLLPEFKRQVLENRHGWFLPTLDLTQKIENLYLYKVAAAALESVGVKHFLVDGSLLGTIRHAGFIPWDDDIDIGVSIDDWELTKKALSCIEGFTFKNPETLHWKFTYRNRIYPYLDIFLYRMDASYVWAATPFVSKSFTYPKSSVFPLGESIFEGVKVPVAKDSLRIVQRIFDSHMCYYKEGHIKHDTSLSDMYPHGYSVTKVPCRDLLYMYTMFKLEKLDGSCKSIL